jgi:hypothetical protein
MCQENVSNAARIYMYIYVYVYVYIYALLAHCWRSPGMQPGASRRMLCRLRQGQRDAHRQAWPQALRAAHRGHDCAPTRSNVQEQTLQQQQ